MCQWTNDTFEEQNDIDYMPAIPNDWQEDVMRMEYVDNQRFVCGHSKKERESLRYDVPYI